MKEPEFHPSMTLQDAIDLIDQAVIDGIDFDCPCCLKPVKVQTVSMDNLKIRLLASFANDCPNDWMRRKDISKIWRRHEIIGADHAAIGDGTFAKCAYWGLIEEQPLSSNDTGKKKNSGIWRMTDKGHDFIVGDLAIRPSMRRYNGEFVESSWSGSRSVLKHTSMIYPTNTSTSWKRSRRSR